MFEAIKSLMPLFLAIFFLYGASLCFATAISKKGERKVQIPVALLFVGAALCIWVLSMFDFFGVIGIVNNRGIALLISFGVMGLILSILTAVSYFSNKERT